MRGLNILLLSLAGNSPKPSKVGPQLEKEAYAALRSLQRVKQWVFGHRITVFSDHNPLTYLTEAAPKSAKLLRWALALQEFDVVFQYRAGKTHVVPNLLTRMCNYPSFNLVFGLLVTMGVVMHSCLLLNF